MDCTLHAIDSTETLIDVADAPTDAHHGARAATNPALAPQQCPDTAEVQRIKELICAPLPVRRPKPRTMRPDLSRDAAVLRNSRAGSVLDRVAAILHDGIRRAGEGSVDTLLQEMRRRRKWAVSSDRTEGVLEAIGAILYDQEWVGGGDEASLGADESSTKCAVPDDSIIGLMTCIHPVVRHMLLIDYGFPPCPIEPPWPKSQHSFVSFSLPQFDNLARFITTTARRWRQGKLPDEKAWDHIVYRMADFEGGCRLDIWDTATLLYYWESRRKPVDPEAKKEGWTGYTGVLQEMVAEVHTRGTDRLARKLSLDIHQLIPKFVSDRATRECMLSIAKDFARRHGISLTSPRDVKREAGGPGWQGAWFTLLPFAKPRSKVKQE